MDHETLRLDAIEWGATTPAVENLRRLTPLVFRFDSADEWCVEYELWFPPNEATEANCNDCLDAAISILLKKKEHESVRRWPRREQSYEAPAIYIGHQVYRSATRSSEVVHTVREGYLYTMHSIVSGFEARETYYYLTGGEPPDDEHPYGNNHVSGYLLKID